MGISRPFTFGPLNVPLLCGERAAVGASLPVPGDGGAPALGGEEGYGKNDPEVKFLNTTVSVPLEPSITTSTLAPLVSTSPTYKQQPLS